MKLSFALRVHLLFWISLADLTYPGTYSLPSLISCNTVKCMPGTEPVPCTENKSYSTSCKPCDEGFYQDKLILPHSFTRCKQKRVCPGNEGMFAVEGDVNDKTRDTRCQCDVDRGYHDSSGASQLNNPDYSVVSCQLAHDKGTETGQQSEHEPGPSVLSIICIILTSAVVIIIILIVLWKKGKCGCQGDTNLNEYSGMRNEDSDVIKDVPVASFTVDGSKADMECNEQTVSLLLDESIHPGIAPDSTHSGNSFTYGIQPSMMSADETRVKTVHPGAYQPAVSDHSPSKPQSGQPPPYSSTESNVLPDSSKMQSNEETVITEESVCTSSNTEAQQCSASASQNQSATGGATANDVQKPVNNTINQVIKHGGRANYVIIGKLELHGNADFSNRMNTTV